MIRITRDAGIRTGMSTNATLLDDKRADMLLDSGLDYVILAFDTGPLPEVKTASPWNVAPMSGTEGNPLFPSAEVNLPQQRAALAPEVLAKEGEDSVFLETVVARDGSVAGVTVLQGDASVEQALIAALRQQRFEPTRYRGRFVAVSVYRLISRLEVRSPRT
jgi:hypothetical protein